MEKSNALSIIASRKLVGNGKHQVRVTNVHPYNRDLGNGRSQVAIVNVAAMTNYHLSQAKLLLAQGEFQDATNQNLSISVRDNDYMPSKGEIIEVFVDNVTSKKTGIVLQSVTSFNAAPLAQAQTISLESLMGEDVSSRVEVEAPAPQFASQEENVNA